MADWDLLCDSAKMIDLNEMAVFAKVAESLSFTVAARAFGVPPSTVSRKVTRLEQRLGVALVHRTTRRIALTAAGAEYHRLIKGVLEAAAAADAAAAEHRADRPRGDLKINAAAAFGQAVLAPLIGAFQARYPELRLCIGLSNRRVAIVDDEWDVVIRSGELPDSSMKARLLGYAHRVIVGSPACIARWGAPAGSQDLVGLPCLMYGRHCDVTHWVPAGEGQPALPAAGFLVADDLEFIKRLALDGHGFTLMPRFMVSREMDAGRLCAVAASVVLEPFPVHAVYPGHSFTLPKVRAFNDFLRLRLTAAPDWVDGCTAAEASPT